MSYQRPGVYINETLTPLAAAAEDGSASTAVFVGVNAGGGPTDPTRVTSWAQFTQIFGGFGAGNDLLPFAVYSYFNNGGASCIVVRATNSDAVAANVTLDDGGGTPVDVLKVSAVSPGAWGNDITVDVVSSAVPGYFDLTIRRGSAVERYSAVTADPADPRNVVSLVNSPYSGSQIVTVEYVGPTTWDATVAPADQSATALASGSDGTGTADLATATQRLEAVSGTFDVNLPGVNASAVLNPIIEWAKAQGNVFLVVDGEEGVAADSANDNAADQIALVNGGISRESVVAVYGPWLVADDPTVSGGARALPPGGFVLGQYARTDTVRGVQKAAAGIDASLRGVLGPKYVYSQADLDSLNVAGVNAIRVVPGAGTCIFGARTLSVGMPDRYLNIRRSLITIKYDLINLTRFAVFEENDEFLRSQIRDIVAQYLRTQWSAGVLAGGTEQAAFSVKCDDENNPPASVAQGFVNVTVGVAPQTPAEFIIFNIGQTVTGSTVDES